MQEKVERYSIGIDHSNQGPKVICFYIVKMRTPRTIVFFFLTNP